MLQLCEPAVRPRRLSAEEFCLLARREASGFYRPRSIRSTSLRGR